jgi:hypothetical protein
MNRIGVASSLVLGIASILPALGGCAPAEGPFGGEVRKARLADGLQVEYVRRWDVGGRPPRG